MLTNFSSDVIVETAKEGPKSVAQTYHEYIQTLQPGEGFAVRDALQAVQDGMFVLFRIFRPQVRVAHDMTAKRR